MSYADFYTYRLENEQLDALYTFETSSYFLPPTAGVFESAATTPLAWVAQSKEW
jgi:hypothetical protein